MDKIEVIVHRDSVAAGDDLNAPHELRFWLNKNAPISDIFSELSAKKYLPTIKGSDEHWEAYINESLVCRFTKDMKNPDFLLPNHTQIGAFKNKANVKLLYFAAPS